MSVKRRDYIWSGKARAFSPLAAPVAMFVLAYITLLKTAAMPEALQPVIHYFSYAMLIVGLSLSFWFNRGGVFFILLTIFLTQMVLNRLALAGAAAERYLSTVYPLAGVLVPVNFVVFSFLKERGVTSASGQRRFGFILVQILVAALLVWLHSEPIIRLLNSSIIPWKPLSVTALPQTSLLFFTVSFIILAWRRNFRSSPFRIPFICALVASAVALHHLGSPTAVSLFFAAAGLILTVAVIQDLYRKAYFDELTGLPTRRALKEELLKLGGRYTIAMLDLDYFKKCNDNFGHAVGDQVLKFTAASISEISGGGKPFRYGGEEFTIIFPGKRVEEAIPYLDDLRDRISRKVFILRSSSRPKTRPETIKPPGASALRISITVSIGVAEKGEQHRSAEEVIREADAALYRAKKKGRNCVSR